MTYRILTSLKTFALGAAFRAEARRHGKHAVKAVEPRIRPVDVDHCSMDSDDWMFAAASTPVSTEADRLSREMSRVSGALSGLRGMLRTISATRPMVDLPVNGVSFGALDGDAMLFDGEPMAATYGAAPTEDTDLFVDDAGLLPATQTIELANVA